jgi:hypothetical protein
MDKFSILLLGTLTCVIPDIVALIVAAVISGGCSFDGQGVVEICTNSSLPFIGGTGLFSTYMSLASYIMGGVGVSLLSLILIMSFGFKSIVLPRKLMRGLFAGTMILLLFPLIYVIVYLTLASVNGSMKQWQESQPIMYILMIAWTSYKMLFTLVALVVVPIIYVRQKNQKHE